MAQVASRARTGLSDTPDERPRENAEHSPRRQRHIAFLPADSWTRAAQVATIGLFVIALLWSAHVSQPVLVPVLLAWVIATILLPIVQFMQERNVPRVLTAILLTVTLLAVILSVLLLLAAPASSWLGRATELRLTLQEKLQTMSQPFALLDDVRKTLGAVTSSEPGALKVEQSSANMVTTAVGVLMPAAGQLVLFLGALLFYLIYQERIRTTVVMLFGGHDARLEALRTLRCIDDNMTTYFTTFTLVNLLVGTLTFGLAYLTGLPNPLLWGVLACVLNYIPYVGPAIVAGTLAVAGLVTFPSLYQAAIAPVVYIGMEFLEGQFLTPYLMGRRLELNPFAVFLAIAFCMWLWGAVGAFLAVPLLMAATVAIERAFAESKPALPD
jgi:predicted PurR-regulated permease PerM